MITRIRKRLTYADVVASIALFAALGGGALAATKVPRNSVGAHQLKAGSVTSKKLRRGAVTFNKLANGAVSGKKITNGGIVSRKLATGAVSSAALANGSVAASKLRRNAVTNSAIHNGVVGTNKLGNGVVTTVKLADKSVTAAKLADEVTQTIGTLKPGQTLRGVFVLGEGTAVARSAQSFQFPLVNAPAFEGNVLGEGQASTACPGIAGGNGATPQAAAGQLCVYVTAGDGVEALGFEAGSVSRLGFGLKAAFTSADPTHFVRGQWAVTAP
jgi:hypothetical protein